jgi:hypothetical protein
MRFPVWALVVVVVDDRIDLALKFVDHCCG